MKLRPVCVENSELKASEREGDRIAKRIALAYATLRRGVETTPVIEDCLICEIIRDEVRKGAL